LVRLAPAPGGDQDPGLPGAQPKTGAFKPEGRLISPTGKSQEVQAPSYQELFRPLNEIERHGRRPAHGTSESVSPAGGKKDGPIG
jgi:hypothetical protein